MKQILIFICINLIALTSFSQTTGFNPNALIYDYEIEYNKDTLPAGTTLVDRWGYPSNEGKNGFSKIFPLPNSGVGSYTCNGFTIVFGDIILNNKIGFDDTSHIVLPTSHPLSIYYTTTNVKVGALRRWTICQVLEYIGNRLVIASGAVPDIYVAASTNNGGSTIAYATSFYNAVSSAGFEGGTLFDHITSGIDPTPNINEYDAKMGFDFGDRINNGNIIKINSDANNNNSADIDLFSVTLHEMTHALGFLSRIQSNGRSTITNSFQGVFSLFDKSIVSSANSNLIDPNTYTFVADSTKLISDSLKYLDTSNSKIYSVYSPAPWLKGSSLGHFDQDRDNTQYLMNPYYTGIQRAWGIAEMEVLCNIGYTLNVVSFTCGDKPPVGVSNYYTTPQTSLPIVVDVISGIGQDYDPDGQTVALDTTSIKLLIGLGSVSSIGNSIVFTPASNNFCGNVLIKYRPYTIANNVKGSFATLNITISCPNYCPLDPCNLICNGSFEEDTNLIQFDALMLSGPFNFFNSVFYGGLAGWRDILGSADCYFRNSTVVKSIGGSMLTLNIPTNLYATLPPGVETPTTKSNRYVGLYQGSNYNCNDGNRSESIFRDLVKPLVIGETYRISYKARAICANHTTTCDTAFLNTSFSAAPPIYPSTTTCNNFIGTNLTKAKIQRYNSNNPNNVWTTVSDTFVATDTSRFIILQPKISNANATNYGDMPYIFIDNIRLEKVGNQIKSEIIINKQNPKIGDTIQITLKVCNEGLSAVNNVAISNSLDSAFKIISTSFGSSYPYFTIPNLDTNSCITFYINSIVTNNIVFNNSYDNCLTITSPNACNQSSNCKPIKIIKTDIAITATQETCNKFRVVIGNLENKDAHKVIMQYNPPSCLSTPSMSVVTSGSIVTYNAGKITVPLIGANSSIIIEFTSTGFISSNCSNTITLLSLDETDINFSNNVATVILGGLGSSTKKDTSVCLGNSIQLGYPITTGFYYNWISNHTGSNVISTLPQPIFTPSINTTYVLTTFKGSCVYRDSFSVNIFTTTTPITGSPNICINDSIKLNNATAGGTWSNSNTTIATVSSTGWVKGKIAGTDTIFYTVGLAGCTAKVFFPITVNPNPTLILKNVETEYCSPNQELILRASSNGSSFDWVTPTQTATIYVDTTLTEIINTTETFKYYVTAYQNGCSKKDSATVNVISCYPQCSQNVYTTLTGSIDGAFTANKVYGTYGDLTISGGKTATFLNSEIIMNANNKIIVESRASLTISGCHLYSCNNMWQGIVVQAGGVLIIDSSTAHSSFIEDAYTAIDVAIDRSLDNFYSNNIGKPPVMLSVNNTVFNRNNISISIASVSDFSTLNSSYITIGNNIFTSRKIPFNTLGWSTVKELKSTPIVNATNYPQTPQTLVPPYIDSVSYSDNNFGAFLKSPYSTGSTKPSAGIVLNRVEFSNPLTIGNQNGSQYNYNNNVFDNLAVGIINTNTALNVVNCTFQKGWLKPNATKRNPAEAYGIYSNTCALKQVNIITSTNKPRNTFWNMQYAIKTNDCYNVQVNNANIYSSQKISDTTKQIGKWGIYIENTNYDSISIVNNQIVNIANGIKINNLAGSLSVTRRISIDNNVIRPDFSSISPNGYIQTAITIAGNTALAANKNIPISCSNNQLTNVFNGIVVTSLNAKNLVATGNIIKLIRQVVTGVPAKQYGIYYVGGRGVTANGSIYPWSQLMNNTITGDFANNLATHNQTGIFIEKQNNTELSCNYVDKQVHGFRFSNTSTGIRFWDNTMHLNNKYGFTLDNKGVIGNIGLKPGNLNEVWCQSNNVWDGDSTAWQQANHYRVNCSNGSIADSSKLYVKTASQFNPLGSSIGFGQSVPYQLNQSIITTAPNPNRINFCKRCTGGFASKGTDEINLDIELLERIAREDPDAEQITEEEADAIIANQEMLYTLLIDNMDMVSNSDVLQQFLYDKMYSSLDYSYLTNKALIEGNIPMAAALLNTWSTEATPDFNSYTYYNWIYNSIVNRNYILPIDSIEKLAAQCPLTNGVVVYAARNLYNSLTEQNIMFDESCDNVNFESRKAHTPKQSTNQSINNFSVYPNPTTGYVYITLPNTNSEKVCWQITVTNILGKPIIEKQIRTKASKTFVELKGNKGIYFVKVLNCNTGSLGVEKIILQ